MALVVGENAYITAAEAAVILAGIPDRTAWDGIDAARKDQLLQLATRLLDDLFDWVGQVEDRAQTLSWPRLYVPSRHSRHGTAWWARSGSSRSTDYVSGVPPEIKRACAELAFRLDTTDFTADSAVVDLDIRGAGDARFGPGAFRRALPSAVVDMIPDNWYRRVKGTGGVRSIPLSRA